MSTCNICQFQVTDQSVNQCPNCGAEIKPVIRDEYLDDDVADVIVSGNIQSSIDLPDDPSQEVTVRIDDDLEICSPGDLLAADPDVSEQKDSTSTPPPSPPDIGVDNSKTSDSSEHELRTLSQEQAENIRSNLLDERETPTAPADSASFASNGIRPQNGPNSPRKVDKTPARQPAVTTENNLHTTKSSMSTSSKTQPKRGIAYFHKNFIQLGGRFHPVSGEEIVIGARHYLLKPKKINPQFAIASFSILLAILLAAVGSQFISPTVPGDGSIVGMIVGPDGRPTSSQIEVTLAGTGKKTGSNPAGFFRFDRVPPGIYKINFKFPNGKSGSEDISVVDNQATTLVLGKNNQFHTEQLASRTPQKQRVDINPGRAPITNPANQTTKPKGQSSSNPAKVVKQYSALKLKANVENAKLVVSGQVLGVGNLIYKKLNPGSHRATVSKAGYKPWSGKIKLTADNTYTLSVNLSKEVEVVTEQTYSAQDFYQSGQQNLAKGNLPDAVVDFTEAINLNPSMADAIFGRAEANLAIGEKNVAEIDFVRAGEIFASKKRTSSARSAFDQALKINNKSIPALLNRADLTRKEGKKEAALRDYKAVLRADKNNFRANLEIGKIYYGMGKHRDADKRLKKAREINPGIPKVYHYLMLNYFARDDFKRVKKIYSEFQKNTPEDAVQAFRDNMRNDAILRIVGEYERP